MFSKCVVLSGCGIFNRRQHFYHLFDVPVFQGEQLSQPPVVIGEPHGHHLVPGVLDGPSPSSRVGLMLDSRGGLVGVLVAAGREGRGGLVGVVAAGRSPPVVRRSAGVKAGPDRRRVVGLLAAAGSVPEHQAAA